MLSRAESQAKWNSMSEKDREALHKKWVEQTKVDWPYKLFAMSSVSVQQALNLDRVPAVRS